jgi:hypothetical protein
MASMSTTVERVSAAILEGMLSTRSISSECIEVMQDYTVYVRPILSVA